MVVQKLRPYVTSFSEAIATQYKHGDTVRVGGKIVSILDIGNLTGMYEHNGKTVTEGVYVTLDDGVGLNHLVIIRGAYMKCLEMYGFKIGDLVVADGNVGQLELEEKGAPLSKHPDRKQPVKIMCWNLYPVPEEPQEALQV